VLGHDILYLPGINSQQEPKYICSLHLAGHQYITPESGLTRKVNTLDIQEYFMLGGTIFTGLKQWERAAELLENIVTYPVKDGAVSKIMVQAYKKWILVKILLDGKVPSLRHTTNSNAAKVFHVIGKPYDVVASLFESGPASRLKAEIAAGTDIWRKDGNTGLMCCILAAYQQHQICGLSKVYRTISVSRISESTFSAETGNRLSTDEAVEDLIMEMISCGEVQGTLSRSSNQRAFLTFTPTGPASTESHVEEELADAMGRIKRMVEDIKTTDHLLTHEKEYLRWAHKQKKLGDANSGDGYVGEELGWNIRPDDEDLMAA
jgi:COP9 signalosome complex subunit 3